MLRKEDAYGPPPPSFQPAHNTHRLLYLRFTMRINDNRTKCEEKASKQLSAAWWWTTIGAALCGWLRYAPGPGVAQPVTMVFSAYLNLQRGGTPPSLHANTTYVPRRPTLILVQTEELRHAIETASQAHERDVERRDATLADLQLQLAEVDEQFEVAVRAHLRAIDRLIEIQDGRLLALEQEFARDVRAVEEEFAFERADIVARHNAFRAEVTALQHELRLEESARRAAARAEFEQKREAIRKANLDRISVLHSDMQNALDIMAKKCEDAHAAYLASTDQRTQDFKVLSQRGQRDTAMNERQQRALKRLTKLLQTWRSKMANNVRECEQRNEAMQEERNNVAAHLEALKAKMSAARASTNLQLKATATAAQAVKAQLAANTALAQRILVLAETVRSTESTAEKVFGSTGSHDEVAAPEDATSATSAGAASEGSDDGATAGTQEVRPPASAAAQSHGARQEPNEGGNGKLEVPPLDVRDGETTMEEAARLENFYARYNRALLETLAVERRRDALRAENEELQAAVKHMLEGMSVNESTLREENTLLVVNGRMPRGDFGGTLAANAQLSAGNAASTLRQSAKAATDGRGPGAGVNVAAVEAAIVFNAYSRTANAPAFGVRNK